MHFPNQAPDCLKCIHFYVTWDPSYPRGCREFGFKTRQLPSREVFGATGLHCPQFQRNPKVK